MSILQRARRFFAGPQKNASRERRKLKRVACHQLFLATRAGRTFALTVLDVGFGGFKVTSEHPLGERGDLLHLRRLATDFDRHLSGAYTTGLMVRVAWSKRAGDRFEAGLHLPEAPGSMRISWFKELLKEMGFDEKAVFSKRGARRHRCRLPAQLSGREGLALDLSSGGVLFGSERAAGMGERGDLSILWGVRRLQVEVEVVGVRPSATVEAPKWLHSLKFPETLSREQEKVLHGWLEELSRHG